MNRFEALVALNMVRVGGARLKALAEALGSPEAALEASRSRLETVEGIGPGTAEAIAGFDRRRLDRELKEAARKRVDIITIEDEGYPRLLKAIYDPPSVLYVSGMLDERDGLSLAVVGSRVASLYGLTQARKLAAQLCEAGCTVVSGMARGIDTQAHAGALSRGGRTIAVLGSGLGRIYPPENRGLAQQIAESGAVVTEFPMDTAPLKQNFPARNRIISGLSLGVLVVEAARNSGALITADFALEQCREVFAVPGAVDSPGASGTNDLIRQGAKLVAAVDDILEEFPFLQKDGERKDLPGQERKKPVGREEELLYGIISGGEPTIDDLADRSGIGIGRLPGLLLKMQLDKIIKRLPGNRFSRN